VDAAALTDGDLIERVAARDVDAFAELHRRTARATFGLALRANDDREQAETATRSASDAIWRSAAGFDDTDDAGAWLFDVAARAVGADDPSERARSSWRVHHALTTLSDGEREVVELVTWGELPTSEVAAFLNATTTDVAATLSGALDRLAESLGVEPGRSRTWLASADAPAELPPELAAPPDPPRSSALPVPRRYRSTVVIGAVILACVLFGVGWLIGGAGGGRQEVRSYDLTGAGGATGSVVVFRVDDAGNWPLELSVAGLTAATSRTTTYELWLTDRGQPTRLVGAFLTRNGEADVELSVPTQPSAVDGWAVLVAGSAKPVLRGGAGGGADG
jgi:RNA polymerase sigma-70 factor, ECF subfamily